MWNKNLEFTKTEEEIVRNYNKIYKYIFKYSIIVIIFVISLIILNQQLNKSPQLNINDTFIIEKAKLIWEFNKITNQSIDNKELQIHILQWELNMTQDFIFSTNNLISYKNLILPTNVLINDSLQIKDKNYFLNSWYEITQLENFAKNILFTNSEQLDKSNKNIISLPIKDNITDTFYLSCIQDNKIINTTCNYYINNFINTFFVYEVQKDYKGLKEIFYKLQNTPHKENMCDAMKKYILYSNDTSKELENIFISCGDKYYQDYYSTQLFIEIQEQLQKWYITPTVYTNKLLNNYKLISYQQLIYNDIHNNNINKIRFEAYIYYLQELLKNTEKIDSFYLDLTYWFNNTYLTNILNKLKYQMSDKTKADIDYIINNFNKISNWDNLVWYIGLKTKLVNKNLETNIKLAWDLDITISQQDEINKLLDGIESLSFFKIIREKIVEDRIKITWYFSIKQPEWITPLYVSIIVKNKDDKLIIDTINFSEYKDLKETLSSIISNKDYTIPELYQYLQENIHIFLSDDNISTCDMIKNTINEIYQSNQEMKELEMLECNPQKISIIKHEDINKELQKTYYKITLDNFDITSIMISNRTLEQDITNYLKNIDTNNITIAKIIWEIILYKEEKQVYIQQWSNNIIITLEDFQKFLWTIPNDMVEWNNKIIVEFTIQEINFIWNYNITSKKVWPLYLQNNKVDEEWNIQKDINIDSFELTLTQDNQNKINEFLIDPIKYIKKIDSTAATQYLDL